jgi:PadR family transcriptional regulator PadR
MKFLSRQEELMLLTIWKLGDEAYGVPIREHISRTTNKYWSIGAIYDILDRLTKKKLVSVSVGEPEKVRGGKSKRYYRVTRQGFKSLDEIRLLQKKVWSNLPMTAHEKN